MLARREAQSIAGASASATATVSQALFFWLLAWAMLKM